MGRFIERKSHGPHNTPCLFTHHPGCYSYRESCVTVSEPIRPEELMEWLDDCIPCGEGDPKFECLQSRRPCGHHCNHIWTDDHCHWCGYEIEGEEIEPQ
jgi:hypothetical protein